MRPIRLLFLLLLLASALQAQERRHLAGYVQMGSSAIETSYYLDIIVASGNISGYSITGYVSGSRLQAVVKGTITGTEIIIQESAWPGKAADVYCYFIAHLKPYANGSTQSWRGTFIGRSTNGGPCDGGTMTVTEKAQALDLPMPPPAPIKDTAKKTVLAPPTVTRPVIVPVPAVPKEFDSCMRSYDWKSDVLGIDIWDGWTIDGDVVSLSVGGQSLLSHTRLSENKQHFSVPIHRGLNTITVSLHEEGFDPPNTPNITLYDGNERCNLNISGESGQVVRICVWRR